MGWNHVLWSAKFGSEIAFRWNRADNENTGILLNNG